MQQVRVNRVPGRARRLAYAGVSLCALAMGGFVAPAWAQDTPAATQDADARDDSVITVTGRRAALQAADERKRRSETIIDSVVADEAGKLPDNSITEVLQRVQGVTIVRFRALGDPDHFSSEGSGVQVRGLSGVASRLNGREIFSANNGRALLWGDVTPELMAAVDVYKASTADLIEGGTGGQIDLRTKLPFDFKAGLHVAATGELSMGDLARKSDYSGSALAAGRWSTPIGDIGVLVDVAYSKFSSVSNFFRAETYYKTRIGATDYYIPGGYTYGEEKFERQRTGIYGAVQWAPTDSLTLTGIFFQSRYKNNSGDWGAFVAAQNLAVDPATSKFDSNNGLLSTTSYFTRDPATLQPNNSPITSGGNKGEYRDNSVTRDYSLAFTWAPDDSRLAIRGAVQRVESTSISHRLDVFRDVQFPGTFGMDLTGDLPLVTVPASAQAIFANPASYVWSADMPHEANNRGRLDSASLDLEYKFGDDFFRSVKIGGRWAERTERDFDNGYNWTALGRGWNGFGAVQAPQLTYANAAPGDVGLHIFKNFFHGQAVLPANLYFPSSALVSTFDRNLLHSPPPTNFCGPADWGNATYFNCSSAGPLPKSGYGGPDYRTPGFLPSDQTDYLTRTLAGYALLRVGQEDWLGFTGNIGVRVVNIQNESSGFYQQNPTTYIRNGQTVSLAQFSAIRKAGAEFTRVLPSVNLNFAPSSTTKVRFGYNITTDNASFNALRASGSLGVSTLTNPNNPPSPAPQLPPIFVNFTTNTGNPTLKPTMSNNFDLSMEWYPRQGTTFHVAAFHKTITNLTIYTLTQQPVPVYYTGGTSSIEMVTSTDVANATVPAKVKGIEVGGRMFFDKGFLHGFGVEANYTFVDSKNPGDRYLDINGVAHNDATLQGLSKHNFNATLLYEMDPISFRLSYSWRSRYLQTTNANGTNAQYTYVSGPGIQGLGIQTALPVYGSPNGTLDAGVRFKVTENFSFSVQGTNLLNTTFRTEMGGYPNGVRYNRSWFQSDRRISTGINLAF
ncbi:TonB-dependent receptor [Sphingomonas sp. LB-2]|uniref:TonB-dependent receptor n=1 Tax=Sphingomonas caeni TaxID=2984949 RepID=UPI0022323723|nr:TonB-dependent receptor [Sphingomonas caeni]MCW3849509.1 TonB-dependent receptor [Sphingomonas caeni]